MDKKMPNVLTDSLVLLRDSSLASLKWKKGRIIKTYIGNDGFVRAVDVKTESGIVNRGITEVAPLPFVIDNIPDIQVSNNITLAVQPKIRPVGILQLFLLFTLFCPNVSCRTQLNITEFSHHPGIYFDGIGNINVVEHKWHIIAYYNLSAFYNQRKYFKDTLNTIRPLCNTVGCITGLELVEDSLKDIDELNFIINQECQLRLNNSRKKRDALWKPLNLLGNIANKFLGVLDSEYAEKMEKIIENIKFNEQRQMDLMKAHTTVLDKTAKIIENNNVKIEENFRNIQTEIRINTDMLSRKNSFNTGLIILTMEIRKYKEIQREIHRVLTEFKKGKLNPLLINPHEFNQQLEKIQGSTGSYRLPCTYFFELSEFVEVAVAFSSSCILFHIELPLVHGNHLNLYKMVPVPHNQGSTFVFIKPFIEFFSH